MEITRGQATDLHWHGARQSAKLTGSAWPAICGRGYHSRKREWEYATGRVPRPTANQWMERGTNLEPEARRELSNYLGETIIECGACRHPTDEGFLSSPDGLVLRKGTNMVTDFYDVLDDNGLLGEHAWGRYETCEIKCPSCVVDKTIGNPRVTSYWIQNHSHMHVTLSDKSHLWIYTDDIEQQPNYRYYAVPFDRVLFEEIMMPLRDEFYSFLETDVAPPTLTRRNQRVAKLHAWETEFFRGYRKQNEAERQPIVPAMFRTRS
jgi:hypothetical protein